jgi:hypothetical protein
MRMIDQALSYDIVQYDILVYLNAGGLSHCITNLTGLD